MKLPAFDVQGQGDVAVLLLHGIGGGRSIWADAASGTASAIAGAGCRAVAVDLPGYGDSAALGPPDMDAMVGAVDALITHLAPPQVVLLGHSMGGMVAQELVARHATSAPQRVHGLVLACTSASFGKPDGDWQARFVAERLAPLDAGRGMAGMAHALVPGLLAPFASDHARQVATALMTRVPEATYRSALVAIAGFDRREALAGLRMPVLCLAGEHDRTAPPEVMQRMASRMRGAEFVCLPGAGHIANVEHPAAFNAAVLSFLQRHFSRAHGVNR
jgi:3-oxoadipate enol-lactonase